MLNVSVFNTFYPQAQDKEGQRRATCVVFKQRELQHKSWKNDSRRGHQWILWIREKQCSGTLVKFNGSSLTLLKPWRVQIPVVLKCWSRYCVILWNMDYITSVPSLSVLQCSLLLRVLFINVWKGEMYSQDLLSIFYICEQELQNSNPI